MMSIIPPDCFLRKVPRSLSPDQRLSLDAIRAATDMFELSLNRMEALALSISPDIRLAVASGLMPAIFVDAWAAVMNFDAIGEVVKCMDIKSAEFNAFGQQAGHVRFLRNKFQHFPQNLVNRSNSKGSRFPQYGAIAWTYTPKPEPDRDVSLVVCNLCANTEQMEMRPVNPAGRDIRRPIGSIQLQAYGMTIEFEYLKVILQEFIDFINIDVCRHVNEVMQKHASENGINMAFLSGNNVGPVAFSLSGFLSDDGQIWTMRGADEQNQPHSGITMTPSSD